MALLYSTVNKFGPSLRSHADGDIISALRRYLETMRGVTVIRCSKSALAKWEIKDNMLIWYGERGVVNAAVAFLVEQNAPIAFLKCVHWANGSIPPWLERVKNVKFVVELGLAEFGNPDLILVCESAGEPRPYCIFLEAKVIPYNASAMSNSQGMTQRGYNSACNGQLSLKYRFAKALEIWDGHRDRVMEPMAICQAYRRSPSDGGLGDPLLSPRKLQKRQILQQVLAPLQLAGLPLNHFAFLALTWDRDPFYQMPTEFLPRFLDERGDDIFHSISGQVGWVAYHHFQAVPGLIEVVKPVLQVMVGSVMPTKSDVETASWPRLVSQPVRNMSQDTQDLMRRLEQLSVRMFGRDEVKTYAGSISIKTPSRVEAKIVPQAHALQRFVLLGVRPEWPIADWSGLESRGQKVMDQPFRFVQLPVETSKALDVAESVLTQLRDVLRQTA